MKRKLTACMLAGVLSLSLAVPALAFRVQRLVWRRALRRYTSAGG